MALCTLSCLGSLAPSVSPLQAGLGPAASRNGVFIREDISLFCTWFQSLLAGLLVNLSTASPGPTLQDSVQSR